MKKIKVKPQNITIVTNVHPEHVLIDKRHSFAGLVLGTPLDLAKQYGIDCKKTKQGLYFSAPKNRLQLFVEKLHFAGIQYL